MKILILLAAMLVSGVLPAQAGGLPISVVRIGQLDIQARAYARGDGQVALRGAMARAARLGLTNLTWPTPAFMPGEGLLAVTGDTTLQKSREYFWLAFMFSAQQAMPEVRLALFSNVYAPRAPLVILAEW